MIDTAFKNQKGSYVAAVLATVGIVTCLVYLASLNTLKAQETTSIGGDENILVDGMPLVPSGPLDLVEGKGYSIERIGVGPTPSGDFVVGPGKIELEVKPGESKTVMMMVTNRIGKTHDFFLATEDTRASNDPTITVELLGGERGPYSLKDYVILPPSPITLEYGERARFPVTISIPTDAEPGGLYGSVLVKTLAVERRAVSETNLVPQSPIEARIGTLFFVTIPGEVERAGQLLELNTIPDAAWFEQGPITFGILYENTGSIHLTPYGKLSITNILGDEVGFVELDPWFALPKSQRFREIFWDNTNLFGRYTATLELNRGYGDIIDTKTITFWVLPWKIVLGGFAGIFIILFLIRTFFKNFEFKRKV